jgi:murein DD-endopeptidase MepM/ murein hydrolase activator NlpD
MRCRMRTLLGSAVALAALLAALVPPAAAQAGGAPGPSPEGGSEYAAPLRAARPMRPVARHFSVTPRAVVAPALPKVILRVDEPGARTVRARVVLLPQTETGAIVRMDLGRIVTGRAMTASWPADTAVAPGRYLVLLHVRGIGGRVLARSAAASGRTTLTVRAPAPAPVPAPAAAGHVFPVAGPHTYGDRFGAPRNGYSHQGQDILAAEGTPVVAPVAGSISFTDNQPKAAGYYVVEKGSDGYDYFIAHCQEGSTAVVPGQPVVAGQPLCAVGHTGDATGPHLHFEVWQGGWRVDANSAPLDPLPFLQAWDVSAQAGAVRR